MTTPATPTMPSQTSRRPLGRALDIVLSLAVAVVFIVLWVGFAIGLATGGGIIVDAWPWLTGLEPLPAAVAWILCLPIGVGSWAWNADLEPLVMGLVMVGLAAWTLVAAAGLARTFGRR